MDWYRIFLSAEQYVKGEESLIQGRFERVFMAAGGPKGAALFSSGFGREETDETVEIYFTPQAYQLAKLFLDKYPGEFCNKPDPRSVTLLAGYPVAGRLLD